MRQELGLVRATISAELSELTVRTAHDGARHTVDESLRSDAEVLSARALLEQLSQSRCPTYTTQSADPLDQAVVRCLNHLALPIPLHVRRVGPGGEYMIDRRVQLRLHGDEVMVRRLGASNIVAESLATYLLNLYLPVLHGVGDDRHTALSSRRAGNEGSPEPPRPRTGAMDIAASQPSAPGAPPLGDAVSHQATPASSSHAEDVGRVARLQREQQELTARLHEQQEVLRQLRAGGSATPQQGGPLTPRTATAHTVATPAPFNKRVPASVQRGTAAAALSVPQAGLAALGEEQIELLKKLALAKQVKEMRRQQSIAARKL